MNKFGDILAMGMERLEKIWEKLEKNEGILKTYDDSSSKK